jgi:hypothetical protein
VSFRDFSAIVIALPCRPKNQLWEQSFSDYLSHIERGATRVFMPQAVPRQLLASELLAFRVSTGVVSWSVVTRILPPFVRHLPIHQNSSSFCALSSPNV